MILLFRPRKVRKVKKHEKDHFPAAGGGHFDLYESYEKNRHERELGGADEKIKTFFIKILYGPVLYIFLPADPGHSYIFL